MMTLNAEIEECDNDGSEHQNRKMWWGWLWTPKLKNATLNIKLKTNDGSERRNRDSDSECQTKKWWWWLWTSNWKHDDDSERRNWETMVALNAKWRSGSDDSECRKLQMNSGSKRQTARKWWGGNMPQCGMTLQISICWKGLKGTP